MASSVSFAAPNLWNRPALRSALFFLRAHQATEWVLTDLSSARALPLEAHNRFGRAGTPAAARPGWKDLRVRNKRFADMADPVSLHVLDEVRRRLLLLRLFVW